MHCLDCDYPLKHLESSRCPECGRDFDPLDATTYRPLVAAERRHEAIREIKGTLISTFIVALIGVAWLLTEIYWIGHGVSCCGFCYLWLALLGLLIGLWRVIKAWRGFTP